MKYTVKKFHKGERIAYQEINVGCIKGIETVYKSTGYAVVDENGEMAKTINRLTGKEDGLFFSLKNAAQKEADYLSR